MLEKNEQANHNRIMIYYILATCISVLVPLISKIIIHYIQIEHQNISIPIIIFIFYLCQFILGVGIFKLITSNPVVDLSETFIDLKVKLKWVPVYLCVWLIIVLAFYVIAHILNPDLYAYVSSWWVLDSNAFMNEMLTTCLQAGFFEEPFFRGVVAQLILYGTGLPYNEMKSSMKVIVVCYSGLLFSLAHVYYEIFPFRILPLDYTQLITTFIVGCIMTHFYFKTRSIIGPILAHTGGNIIQVLIGYGYVYIMKP